MFNLTATRVRRGFLLSPFHGWPARGPATCWRSGPRALGSHTVSYKRIQAGAQRHPLPSSSKPWRKVCSNPRALPARGIACPQVGGMTFTLT